MTNVINVDDKRLKKKGNAGLKGLSLKRPATDADANFNSALAVFADCSSLGKKRQLNFLYEIMGRYWLTRRPISVEEMTVMMTAYLQKNKGYFEKITGNPWPYDFQGEVTLEQVMRRINFGVKESKKVT